MNLKTPLYWKNALKTKETQLLSWSLIILSTGFKLINFKKIEIKHGTLLLLYVMKYQRIKNTEYVFWNLCKGLVCEWCQGNKFPKSFFMNKSLQSKD